MTTTGKRSRKQGVPQATLPSTHPAILMPESAAAPALDLAALVGSHPGADIPSSAIVTASALVASEMPVPVATAISHPEPAAEPVGPVAAMPAPPAAVPAVTAEKDIAMDTNAATAQVQDQANRLFADAKTRTEDAVNKGTRMVEDMNGFAKGNVEALVESSRIAVRGFEMLGQNAADYARKSFEGMTAAVKTLAQAKSPTEFLQIQGDLARQGIDAAVAETSRSTEAMLKLAGEVAQPISNRMAIAADRIKLAA